MSFNNGDWCFGPNCGADDGSDGIWAATPPTPLPAALPLFATGLGALGLLGWRRKRRTVGDLHV